jgi:beta-galactosidase
MRSLLPLLLLPCLGAAEPWFAAELDNTTDASAGGRALTALSGGRLPFTTAPAGAAVAVRRFAYDQKGSLVWRAVGGLPRSGTLALAFRGDAEATGERPLTRLACGERSLDLVVDAGGRPLARLLRSGTATVTVAATTTVADGAWHGLAVQWDLDRGSLALVADAARSEAAVAADPAFAAGSWDLWLGATTLDNFTGAAAEGAFDWLRVVPGADAAALTAARTVTGTGAAVAATSAEGGPLAPQPPDAEETRRWDTAGAARSRTASGDRLCLNGTWRFLPAPGPRQRPEASLPWLRTRLPGRWLADRIFPVTDAQGKTVREVAGKPLNRTYHGWLVRQVQVPADFRGQRLLAACDLICADEARFYRDGRLVGEFANATFHERISVRPYVDQYTATDASLVDLALEGRGAVRTTSAVLRSTDDGHAEVLATVVNPGRTAGSLAWSVRVLATDGALAREVPGGALAFAAGDEVRELRLMVSWDGLERWSPETPALHRFQVVLRDAAGSVIDETEPRACGVRRFTLERDGFHLDGVRRRILYDSSSFVLTERYALFNADPAQARATVRELKESGYNTIGVEVGWHGGCLGRTPYMVEPMLAAADELGLLVVLHSPPFERGDELAAYRRLVHDYVRAWGSHPSLAMHLATFNDCWYALGQHPQAPLLADYRPMGKDATRARALAWEAALREADPGRPVYHNASGNLTPLFTTMHYLSFGVPLQEREDFPAAWSAVRPNVLFPSEIGLPYFEQFKDFDFPERNHGPLLTVEHAARYLGDRAYALADSPSLRDTVLNKPYDGDRARPELMALKALFAERSLRGWRAWDMPGIGLFGEATFAYLHAYDNRTLPRTWAEDRTWGIKPAVIHLEHRQQLLDRPTPYRDVLRTALAPVTATLGGPGSPTAKTHAWFAGEAIAKEAVLVNDGVVPLDLALSAELRDGTTVLARWDGRQSVAAGAVVRVPFTLIAPTVRERRALTLALQARTSATAAWSDQLAVEIFPAHRPPGDPGVAVAVFDPKGLTLAMLARAGVPARPAATVEAVRGARVLVIGREALGVQRDDLLAAVEEAGLIEAGLNVLVFEQAPGVCGNLVHTQARQRVAFVRDAGHPALAGLADADLHDWRGASTLVAATSPVTREFETSPHYPHVKYFMNADGIVAGWTIRRPDRGGWRVLVDAGFDLGDACLLEQRRGRGRVLLCQLEVTARYGSDPAATRLADNLLRCAATAAQPVARSGVLLGSGAWATAVAEAFPALRRTPDAASDLLVLAPATADEGENWAAHANAVVARGGTVVWLHPGGAADLGWLGMPLMAVSVEAWRASPAAGLPGGIGPADLHWRYPRGLARFTGATAWCEPGVLAEQRIGRGRVVLVGLPLAAFTAAPYALAKPYTSFIDVEMQRKPLRLVEALLSACGATPLPVPLFAGALGEDNTVGGLRAVLDLPRWRFTTDPEDRGGAAGWEKPAFDDGAWRELVAGRSWEAQGVTTPAVASHRYPVAAFGPGGASYAPYDGFAWYRTRVTVPEAWRGGDVHLVMATVDDTDRTFLDGELIGVTDHTVPKHWEARRDYLIPAERLRFGHEQVIAIRVHDLHGDGGLRQLPVRLEVRPRLTPGPTPYLPWRPAYDPDAFHQW